MIKLGSIGFNHTHGSDYVFDCLDGPGAWLFLLIKTPAFISVAGEKFDLKPGTAVILEPRTPCRYGAANAPYADDWFYFNMDPEDVAALSKMGIEAGKPVPIGAFGRLSNIIYDMTVEFYSNENYHSEIASLFTDILFKRISRAAANRAPGEAGISADKKADLANLRSRIYRSPADIPPVAALAEEAGMSVSGLEHRYKKAFGTSVISDIVSSRVNYAKRLLLSTDMLVSDISERCGYNSCYSFMRQFKSKTGRTPSEFRKLEAVGVHSEKI